MDISYEKIKYAEVESYNNELHQKALEIKDLFDDIKKNAEIIRKAENWNGNAQIYYMKKLDEFMENFDEIYRELENCVIYIAACSDGYQALDSQVSEDILTNLNLQEITLTQSEIFSLE